ncbi:vacuolar protein sorting-associated protein 52 homolog isoform X2 [Poecile atricapillus]|uniref:vacuolar protein sorting-associated protein 52 homolog isoform X2 n=1 Tax=Poecile atricapillus TaxID=48891 RepID=UPI002738677A|nr:vacuolar protein sorting-associated protein 52 homolog isoform X2 [Poecile atricapillus]
MAAQTEVAAMEAPLEAELEAELDLEGAELEEVDVHIQENLEDALVQEALQTGVDLRQYSRQVELELQEVERASIQDYIRESENIAELHNQISACDAILERMEQMLGSFQSSLSSLSWEIRALQGQAGAMNLRLRNRRQVRERLGGLLDELVVPPEMISVILESPVTSPEFLAQLRALDAQLGAVKAQAFRDTLACADVQHVLDRLRIKAVTKIREFVLQKIYSFRKPMTNYQIPQNSLLKYKFFYQFLLGHERAAAQELREQYVDTMSRIHFSYFKSYTGRLMKIQYEEVADKDDLMGVEDTARKGFFSKPSLRSRNTVFTLGNRGAVIGPAELEAPIIVPHAAQRGEQRYPFESLFRSQHYALLDTSCREFSFLTEFFLVAGAAAQELFNSVMGKTLGMFQHMESYVSDCYDAIAVFLCIHLALRFRSLMAKRNVPAVDGYWGWLLELLWPRFELILELHIQSVQGTDPQRLGGLDTRPHYITRRYAEFSSAIVSINQTLPSERSDALLARLQLEVENLVLRAAAEFPSRREQLIFLINNYDMMLAVLMERAVEESKEAEGFQQLLSARTQEFVEELLAPPFGGLVGFVREAEALLERGEGEKLRGHEARVTQLIRGFSGSWKSAVETLSQDVMRSFSNFRIGTGIIQAALTQLIQVYHRFQKILEQPPLRALPARADLINIHHLMVELKKHKPNF